jgi:hypothetical protein
MLGLIDLNNFDQYCNDEIGSSYKDWFAPKYIGESNTVILIDEAQMLYPLGRTHGFWRSIKEALRNPPKRFHMMLFATYGEGPETSVDTELSNLTSPTPVVFPKFNSLDISTLRFTTDEYNELLENYHKTRGGKVVPIDEGKCHF